MAGERRTLWLGAALVAALVAIVAVRSMSGGSAPGPAGAARPRAERGAAAGAPATLPGLHLDALTAPRGEPVDSGRNPFRFQARAAAAMPPGPVGSPLGTPAGSMPAPPAPTGPPAPPPITLKFIGVVQKADGTKIAVLSDGKRPYYGLEGEAIEGQYRILKIGLESLEIAYLDGRGRRTIPLTGQ